MRAIRLLLVGLGIVVTAYVAASIVSPEHVPRLAVLPKPAATTWSDGCTPHTREYHRTGIFWGYDEGFKAVACGR